MNRIEGMLSDIKANFGVVIEDEIPDVLCDGDGCRHSECSCWDDLQSQLEDMAEKQVARDAMQSDKVYDQCRDNGDDFADLGELFDTVDNRISGDRGEM
jgi:hypothetical protein